MCKTYHFLYGENIATKKISRTKHCAIGDGLWLVVYHKYLTMEH